MWLTWLADAARTTGYPVVEDAGWLTRGNRDSVRPDGSMSACEGVVGHHTAGPPTGNYPSLRVVRSGRPGLVGLLSHLGLARDGTIYVIGAGHAYHAGTSAHAGFTNLNDKYVGIEAESVGDGTWTSRQLDCYPKLCGAVLKHIGQRSDRYASHRVAALPAGRKIDPAGITDTWMRERIDAFMGSGPAPAGEPWIGLPTMKAGDRSAAVMILHRFLVARFPSYANFTPTGFYGPQTTATMKEFQRRTGVAGDGSIVGPQTKKALWEQGFRG